MRLRFLLAAAALVVPLTLNAQSTTYSYTGTDFTYFNLDGGVASFTPQFGNPYTTADHVSGTFTLNGNVDNLSGVNFYDNGAFSFTDGYQTLSSAAHDDLFATLWTDASGNITNYAVEASSATDLNVFISIQSFGGSPADFAKTDTGWNIADAGTNTAGTMGAPVVTATPEPSSLALLGSGVVGLAFQLRRRMRRA